MNPAIHAAILATASAKEEASVEARLRAAGALGPQSAIAFEPANDAEKALLDAGLANRTLARSRDGNLFLDERALAERNSSHGRIALLILFVLSSIIASAVALAVAL